MKSLNVHKRGLIDQVARIYKLVHVNPATSSTGERMFSTAGRVKTRLDGIGLVSVANAIVSLNDNRKRNFGKFTVANFH